MQIMTHGKLYMQSPDEVWSLGIMTSSGAVCWICHQEGNTARFCKCKGSCEQSHRQCLEKWLETCRNPCCRLCGERYRTKLTGRPLQHWKLTWDEILDMSAAIGAAIAVPVMCLLMAYVLHEMLTVPLAVWEQVVCGLALLFFVIINAVLATFAVIHGPQIIFWCYLKNKAVTVFSVDEAKQSPQGGTSNKTSTSSESVTQVEPTNPRTSRLVCRSCRSVACCRAVCY